MSTKATLPSRITTPNAVSYPGTAMTRCSRRPLFYLELHGASVELSTREQGGTNVVLHLPIETAKQLGLQTMVQPERCESACDENKAEPLRRLQEGSGAGHARAKANPRPGRNRSGRLAPAHRLFLAWNAARSMPPSGR